MKKRKEMILGILIMSELNKIEKFQLFCIEQYKVAKNISGAKALAEFEKYDLFPFLDSGYELLHTQSLDYTIKEITKYIEARK